jgi:hypothetical protein
MSPVDVLMQHSLFGIYSQALSPEAADNWAELILKEGKFKRQAFHSMLPGRASSKRLELGTANLRSCAACVADDEEKYGFPSWDVLHLVPAVFHCPRHGNQLVSEADARPGRNLWKPQLPEGMAPNHKQCPGPPASDGYAHYLKLWVELFEGRLPVVAFHNWTAYIETSMRYIGSASDAKKILEKALSKSWGLNLTQISEALGAHVVADFLDKELHHNTTPVRIAQKLVLLTGLESVGLVPVNGDFPHQGSLHFSAAPQSIESQLRGELSNLGYSPALADHLLAGSGCEGISSNFGVDSVRLAFIFESLSTRLLTELLQDGPRSMQRRVTSILNRRPTLEAFVN